MKLRYMALLPVAMIALWSNQANAADTAVQPALSWQPGYYAMAKEDGKKDNHTSKAVTGDAQGDNIHKAYDHKDGKAATHHGQRLRHHKKDTVLCDGTRQRQAPLSPEQKEERKKALDKEYAQQK